MDQPTYLAAIASGQTDLAVELVGLPGGASARDPDGVSALVWCAHYGDLTAMRLLLQAGADRTELGADLGLRAAAFHGHESIVAWCLGEDADIQARDEHTGESALHAALCRANRPAHERIALRLIASGADVHARTIVGAPLDSFMRDVAAAGETPLHRAAAFSTAAVIDALCAAGASREAQDAHGQTPLAWASWHLRPDDILRRLCYGPHRLHPQRGSTYDHGTGWTHTEQSAPPTRLPTPHPC
jgi:ankyrin repeat protein